MPSLGSDQNVSILCFAFADGLRAILVRKLVAVYVYGAVTFPETTHTGDIDFHAILSAPPTEEERSALLGLHERLADEFPPLGAELDGYHILLDDARGVAPPQHLLFPHLRDDSFALHRAHMLAGRVWILLGPDPKTVYAPPAWGELATALDSELDYVTRHLLEYPAYCILNLCRLLYSWETHDVVTSKVASAAWARLRCPEWRPLIDAALRKYAHSDDAEDRAGLEAGVGAFHRHALGTIGRWRGR